MQVRKSFGMDHETITALAEKEAAGCEGVNFLPYITGERTPNWPHSAGVITGLRPGSMRPGLLYRAAMEGATYSLLAGTLRVTSSSACFVSVACLLGVHLLSLSRNADEFNFRIISSSVCFLPLINCAPSHCVMCHAIMVFTLIMRQVHCLGGQSLSQPLSC